MDRGTRTLGPAVAGTWYPRDAVALAAEVDGYLDRAAPPAGTDLPPPRAMIEPHAGFVYSGQVAAHGFARVRGRSFRRVLLIGPSHYAAFRGAVVPRGAGAYRTPLGDVSLDGPAIEGLAAQPGFRGDDDPFGPEHSLEAEIPFLQRALQPGFLLVPVLIGGDTRGERAAEIARGLAGAVDDGTLIVVSSDFTHYGRRFGYVPFEDDLPRRIRELDLGAVAFLEQGDAEGFDGYVAETGATICGRGPIGILLRMLPAGSRGKLEAYDTSGRQTGDWGHTVSYASVTFA
jgi:AmmeMemoRadiSam system protein B